MTTSTTAPTKKAQRRYEQLGRALESVIETGYINHHRVYLVNFIRGVFFGLGAALGSSFVLACIVWILTLFGEVPLIGTLFEIIRNSIE